MIIKPLQPSAGQDRVSSPAKDPRSANCATQPTIIIVTVLSCVTDCWFCCSILIATIINRYYYYCILTLV